MPLDVADEDVLVAERFLGLGIFLDLDQKKVIRHVKGVRRGFHRGFGVEIQRIPFYGIHLLCVLPPHWNDSCQNCDYKQ